MNPAPGLLNDWITIPGFLWLVLGCIALVYLAILTVNLVRVWEEDDAANEDAQTSHVVNWCDRNGHAFCHPEIHDGVRVWRCENCGDVVRPIETVYDQEKDAS
jgi:hypothetical protein